MKHEILSTLNRCAQKYNFPVLDNYNFDFAKARLTSFRGNNTWVILFEIIGTDAMSLSNEVFVYSNQIQENGLLYSLPIGIEMIDNEDWFDADGNFRLQHDVFSLNIHKNKK